MSFNTFVDTVWAANFLEILKTKHVFVSHCTREYEGQLKELGDSVKIKDVGKPTMTKYTVDDNKDTLQGNIPDAENLQGASMIMYVNQAGVFNYFVGDIDKIQNKDGGKLMGMYQQGQAEVTADEFDKYVGQTIFPKASKFTNTYSNATKGYIKVTAGTSATAAADAAQNVLELLDDLVQKARELNIPDSVKLYLECSPKFEKLIRQALITKSTNNVVVIEGKEYLKYYNLLIEWSNNVKTVAADGAVAAYEYVTLRTDKAVAFVDQITETKPYEPEKGFGDAIKGLIVYDAKIIRPNEIINVLVTY